MAENQISTLFLKFYSFRPTYKYPVESRNEPNLGYRILRALYPILKLFGSKYSIKSSELPNAIFNVEMNDVEKQILENQDILMFSNLGKWKKEYKQKGNKLDKINATKIAYILAGGSAKVKGYQ